MVYRISGAFFFGATAAVSAGLGKPLVRYAKSAEHGVAYARAGRGAESADIAP